MGGLRREFAEENVRPRRRSRDPIRDKNAPGVIEDEIVIHCVMRADLISPARLSCADSATEVSFARRSFAPGMIELGRRDDCRLSGDRLRQLIGIEASFFLLGR